MYDCMTHAATLNALMLTKDGRGLNPELGVLASRYTVGS